MQNTSPLHPLQIIEKKGYGSNVSPSPDEINKKLIDKIKQDDDLMKVLNEILLKRINAKNSDVSKRGNPSFSNNENRIVAEFAQHVLSSSSFSIDKSNRNELIKSFCEKEGFIIRENQQESNQNLASYFPPTSKLVLGLAMISASLPTVISLPGITPGCSKEGASGPNRNCPTAAQAQQTTLAQALRLTTSALSSSNAIPTTSIYCVSEIGDMHRVLANDCVEVSTPKSKKEEVEITTSTNVKNGIETTSITATNPKLGTTTTLKIIPSTSSSAEAKEDTTTIEAKTTSKQATTSAKITTTTTTPTTTDQPTTTSTTIQTTSTTLPGTTSTPDAITSSTSKAETTSTTPAETTSGPATTSSKAITTSTTSSGEKTTSDTSAQSSTITTAEATTTQSSSTTNTTSPAGTSTSTIQASTTSTPAETTIEITTTTVKLSTSTTSAEPTTSTTTAEPTTSTTTAEPTTSTTSTTSAEPTTSTTKMTRTTAGSTTATTTTAGLTTSTTVTPEDTSQFPSTSLVLEGTTTDNTTGATSTISGYTTSTTPGTTSVIVKTSPETSLEAKITTTPDGSYKITSPLTSAEIGCSPYMASLSSDSSHEDVVKAMMQSLATIEHLRKINPDKMTSSISEKIISEEQKLLISKNEYRLTLNESLHCISQTNSSGVEINTTFANISNPCGDKRRQMFCETSPSTTLVPNANVSSPENSNTKDLTPIIAGSVVGGVVGSAALSLIIWTCNKCLYPKPILTASSAIGAASGAKAGIVFPMDKRERESNRLI